MDCQRDDFLLPRDLHFLNCAYMAPLSKRVVNAGARGVHLKTDPSVITPDRFFDEVNSVREVFGAMINAPPERVAAFLAANSLFRFDNVHIDRFTLFSSRLGRSGPVYRAEVEYDLDAEPIPANGDPSKPRTGPGPA